MKKTQEQKFDDLINRTKDKIIEIDQDTPYQEEIPAWWTDMRDFRRHLDDISLRRYGCMIDFKNRVILDKS